jgi:hypothetical protein
VTQLVPRGNGLLVLSGRENNFLVNEYGEVQDTGKGRISPILINFNTLGLLVGDYDFYLINRANKLIRYNILTSKALENVKTV